MGWQDAPEVAAPAAQPAWASAPVVDEAAPATDAPQPQGIPGLAPGSQPVPTQNGMAARVARMKANPPGPWDKVVGAVEAGLNAVSSITNFPANVGANLLTGQHPLEGSYSQNVYQPKTDVGQEYVEDVVAPTFNQLGPVIGHGHEAHAAAPAVAPAVRAAGDTVRPVAAAAGEAAAKGAAKVIGVDPELAKVAQIAGDLKHPIDVRPDQLVKGAKFSKLAGQAAADVPLSGSKNAKNQVNFTRNVISELNPEESADRLTPETFAKAMDRSGGGIGEIMGRTDVPLDTDMRSATDTLRRDVNAKGTDADAKILNAYIDELHSKAGDDGVINGTALRELNSEIGLRARQNVGNDLGSRLNDLQGIIEDAVQKNVKPEDGAALKDFRRQYAYGKILEPTVAKTIDGVLPPSQLMGAVTRTTLGKHLMAMGKGGPMGDLAKVGQLIKEPGSSGTAERHLVYGAGLGGLGYVEPHVAAATYGGALGYNVLGPKLTRAMVGKRPKKAAPPPPEPPAPPPEPTTSPGAGGPRGGGGGGAPPGPLGDLTPDWGTTPGAGGGPPRGGHEPGLVRAIDEEPPTTGMRRSGGPEMPEVPGKPGVPDTIVSGRPGEQFLDEKTQAALNEPGAIEARKQQAPKPPEMPKSGGPSMVETERLLAAEETPAVRKVLQDHLKKLQADETEAAAKVAREHDALALEKAARDTTDSALQARLLKQADALRGTEKIPVGKATEGQPEIKPPKTPETIPKGEATEITPEYIEADRQWRAEHKLGAEDAQRARNVATALQHDEKAVHAAVRQFEHQPRAFDREIARITEQGEMSPKEILDKLGAVNEAKRKLGPTQHVERAELDARGYEIQAELQRHIERVAKTPEQAAKSAELAKSFEDDAAKLRKKIGEARANESKQPADSGDGNAEATGAPVREDNGAAPVGKQQGHEPVPTTGSEAAGKSERDTAAAVRAADEQPRTDSAAKTGAELGGQEAPGGRAPAGETPVRGVERRSLIGGSIFDRLKAEGAAQKARLATADIERAGEAPAAPPAKAGVEIREVPGGFEAYRDGKKVGYLKDNLERGQAEQIGENANVDMVKVDKEEQGKGTGRALYKAFEEKHGGRIMPSGKTEPSAWKLWKRNYPEKVDAFVKQEAARIRDGADPQIVAGNITDPEVRARVLKESEPPPSGPKPGGKTNGNRTEQLQPDALRSEAPPEADIDFSAEAHGQEPFYSQLTRSVEALKQGKANAEQWTGILKNLKGVKPEEIEWSGVNDWLKAQDGPVTREALTNYLREGGVKVTEVTKGAGHMEVPHDLAQDIFARDQSQPTNAAEWSHLADYYEREAKIAEPHSYNWTRAWHLAAQATEMAEHLETGSGSARGAPKYSSYQLPGGTNYREVLLTLPPKAADTLTVVMHPDSTKMFALRHADGEYVRSGPESITPGTIKQWHSREFAEQYGKDAHDAARKMTPPYTSPHWQEKNVLAHIRLNDRVDADGKKVLFVEEIQSDWAQAGKKKDPATGLPRGFALSSEKTAPMDSEYRALVHKNAEAREAGREPLPADVARAKELEAALARSDKSKIPEAPFVQNTNAWTALAIKRIAKLASDEGYDRVAFINGEQSAARYDLSKHIDRIDYHGENGRFDISAIKNGEEIFSKENLSADELEDHVGKDVAAKMIAGEGSRPMRGDVGRWEPEDGEHHYPTSLSGLDLKVGGEGMKAFYDKIVPNVAKDVVKKLGGDGLTTTTPTDAWKAWDKDGKALIYRTEDEATIYFPTEDDARAAIRGNGGSMSHHARDAGGMDKQVAFDITPQMRANAEGGVPLFKQGEPAPAASRTFHDSPEALDKTLRDKFGDKLVQGLLDQGVLKYASNLAEQPEGVRRGVKAILRRPQEGQHAATLYYDRLTADEAPGVLMHELGEHFGIVRVLGQERYNVMLNDLRKMKDEPEVRAAWDHVKKNYIGANSQKMFVTTEDPGFVREVAARLVETQPELPFVRRLINEIRAFFYEKFGTTMSNRVDANLIRGLAASALRKASQGTLPDMKGNVSPVHKPFVAPGSSSRSSFPTTIRAEP